MRVTRRAFLGGAVSAAGLAGIAGKEAIAAPQPQPYVAFATLGVCGPFTGDHTKLGEQIANGVRQACDDANLIRGTLDRAYQLRTFDDGDLLASGIVTAGFACDDPSVVCVIGHLNGHITEQAAKIYANRGMPLIVPASTFDRITEDGLPNVVRLPTKDFTEGRLCGKYVSTTWKPSRVAVAYQDGDYGYDVANGFSQQMDADKIALTTVQFSFDKPQFSQVAAKALQPKPDAVFLPGNVEDMGLLLRELRDAGFAGRIMASQGFFKSDTLSKYATYLDKTMASTPLPPLELAPSVFRVRTSFQQRYGPGSFTYLAAFGYAAAQVAISALGRSGSNDRLSLLRQLQLPAPYQTAVGTYQFLPSGDAVQPNIYFYSVRDGRFRYETSAVPTTFLAR
ncbi:MAG: ABC transporter substrate-binding protein [Candidatus Eremiobacteraeota bacterium]|nr:ABC transporter substrate-binding protein [Candidatus Eremiobacteraeota bacterium]